MENSAHYEGRAIDFFYQPEIEAPITEYVQYICPVNGVKELLANKDPKLAENPLIFPDDETLGRVSGFDSKALNNQDYIEQWQTLLGA